MVYSVTESLEHDTPLYLSRVLLDTLLDDHVICLLHAVYAAATFLTVKSYTMRIKKVDNEKQCTYFAWLTVIKVGIIKLPSTKQNRVMSKVEQEVDLVASYAMHQPKKEEDENSIQYFTGFTTDLI